MLQAERAAEEKRQATAAKRRAAERATRRAAREAEDSPMPTSYPDYPDWKAAPPHVLKRNEEIREENRLAAERAEATMMEMRARYLEAAEQASGRSRGESARTPWRGGPGSSTTARSMMTAEQERKLRVRALRPKSVRSQGPGAAVTSVRGSPAQRRQMRLSLEEGKHEDGEMSWFW